MNPQKQNIWRVVLCALLLCALVAGMMYFTPKLFDLATKKLENLNPQKEGDMKNMLWLIDKVLNILPVCVLCIVLTAVYTFNGRGDKVGYCEKFVALSATALFTFLVLLPAVALYSKSHPTYTDAETGQEVLSLAKRTAEWFMWQFLLFCPFIFYYRVKSTEEKFEEQETKNEE